MYIYKIEQDKVNGADAYDAAVVVATSKKAARKIHPNSIHSDWGGELTDTWSDYRDVVATYVGVAGAKTEAGVVVASFNAG